MRTDVVFIDVDTQRDFMDEDGALAVPNAAGIRENLRRLTEAAGQFGMPVIATVDTHTPDDPEFEQFGRHCVAGSHGAEKIEETSMSEAARVKLGDLPPRGAEEALEKGQVIVEKNTLDALGTPAADALLKALPQAGAVVYGVATEYCVKRAVEKLLKLERKVLVVKDATRGISEEKHEQTLDELTAKGAGLATTAHLLDRLASEGPSELL